MPDTPRYRFGIFDFDAATGELRRKGIRIKLHAQPIQVLQLLLARPGQMLTREEICSHLWPDGSFVDFDHGLNSAINRLREALGDRAANPQFIETLARRGYRFLAPVELITTEATSSETTHTPSSRPDSRPTLNLSSRPERSAVERSAFPATNPQTTTNPFANLLATPADLPPTSPNTARNLFLALQLMYLAFYIGALANLPELNELFASLPFAHLAFTTLIITATLLIPVRIFLITATLFQAPNFRQRFLRLWPFLLLPLDTLWSLAPFLLLHHMSTGLALACTAPLVYSPFAQRSLILMATQPTS